MFNIGDIVKTNNKDKKFCGRVGEIVRIVLTKNNKYYTVQFTQDEMYSDYFTGGMYEYPEDCLIFVKKSGKEIVDKFQVGAKVKIQYNFHDLGGITGEVICRYNELVHVKTKYGVQHYLLSELQLADDQELTEEDNREIAAVQHELNVFLYDISHQHSVLVKAYKKWKKK